HGSGRLAGRCGSRRGKRWDEHVRMARRRILLVGGDPSEAAVLTEYFRHGYSYEIETIEYCDDALKALSRQTFDLSLLLSIFALWRTLPSMSSRFGGLELLKQMRALHIQIPALVISASTLAQAKKEALANGAVAFLPKPVNLAELDRCVVLALEAKDRNR